MLGAEAAENHGDEWGLTWYLGWGIYTSIPTWAHSQNYLAAAEALSLKIFININICLYIHKHKHSHKLCDEMEHPVLSLMESQWKLRHRHDQDFPMDRKPEQILASEERNWSKTAGTVRVTVSDLSRKVNYLSKVVWDIKIRTELTSSIISTIIDYPVLTMDVKVSKDKHISRWIDRENLIYVRWNRIKNHA